MAWTPGDVSGSETLTDNDHLYPIHVNELRTNVDATNSTVTSLAGTIYDTFTAIVDINGNGQYTDIQTAINAVETNGGGAVFICEGTYTISTALTLCNNLAIIGEGPGTILKLANNTDAHIINNDGSIINNFYIGNLSIDGNAANQTSTTATGIRGIFQNTVMENLWIKDTCAQAIAFVGGSNCRDYVIRGVTISFTNPKATSEGIFVRGERGSIVNNVVRNTGDSGIILEEAEAGTPSAYITVSGNSVFNCANYGIVYSNTGTASRGVSITGNTIGSCVEGIIISYSNDVAISGNSIYGCASDGILVTGTSTSVAISGNLISNNGTDGIQIGQTSSGVAIVGNTIHNNTNYGINAFQTASLVTITGNSIFSNQRSGVNLGSASSRCTISGNLIYNNDQSNGAYNGIDIGGGTAIVVTGNSFFNTSGTIAQDYAVRSFNNSDYNLVVGNNTIGNAVGTISLVGSNNVVASNI